MKVSDLHGALRGIDPRDTHRPDGAAPRPAARDSQTEFGDSLDLSVSARVSTLSTPEGSAGAEAAALAPDRLALLRGRIASGHYDRPGVLAEISTRIQDFYAR